MWSIKYEFRHSDCKYLYKADELKVKLYTYPINSYIENNAMYISAVHRIEGDISNVKKYISYLKKISLKNEIIDNNTVFTFAKKTENLDYYGSLYNQHLIFPKPILHTNNKEEGEILSWDRKSLIKFYNAIKNNKHTKYFKVLSLKNKSVNKIMLMNITNSLTDKQKNIFEYAVKEKYYNYPRKINLDQISKRFEITKSTCHEILRRAETNIIQETFTH